MTAALTVPNDWAQVTPEWLTAALAEHHPGAVVDRVTIDMRDDGTNRRARLAVTYSSGSGLWSPTTVITAVAVVWPGSKVTVPDAGA